MTHIVCLLEVSGAVADSLIMVFIIEPMGQQCNLFTWQIALIAGKHQVNTCQVAGQGFGSAGA